jgi:excisionase family DNA binding protein
VIPLEDRPITLTPGETAELLRIGRSATYSAIARGEIPSVRVGHRILIPRPALERWLAGGNDSNGDTGAAQEVDGGAGLPNENGPSDMPGP